MFSGKNIWRDSLYSRYMKNRINKKFKKYVHVHIKIKLISIVLLIVYIHKIFDGMVLSHCIYQIRQYARSAIPQTDIGEHH